MKKYILIGLIALTGHYFYASGVKLVKRWEKADTEEAENLWNSLTPFAQQQLVSNLIDAYEEKIIKCLQDSSFLFLVEGPRICRYAIPHAQFFSAEIWNLWDIISKINVLFEKAFNHNEYLDLEFVYNHLDQYYQALKRYAKDRDIFIKDLNKNCKMDLIEILNSIAQKENKKNNVDFTLPGNFAKSDSAEAKLLKNYLLDKEVEDLEEIEENEADTLSDIFTSQTVE